MARNNGISAILQLTYCIGLPVYSPTVNALLLIVDCDDSVIVAFVSRVSVVDDLFCH